MTSQYRRAFIALKQVVKGYGIKGRIPLGRAMIESKNGIGKISLWLQDMKPETIYKCYLVSSKHDSLGAPVGTVNVDSRGKSEIKFEIDCKNVASSGLDLDDFDIVAIIVPNKNEVSAVLEGFKDVEVSWRSRFKDCSKVDADSNKPEISMHEPSKPQLTPIDAPSENVLKLLTNDEKDGLTTGVPTSSEPNEMQTESARQPEPTTIQTETAHQPESTTTQSEAVYSPESVETSSKIMPLPEPIEIQQEISHSAEPSESEVHNKIVQQEEPQDNQTEITTLEEGIEEEGIKSQVEGVQLKESVDLQTETVYLARSAKVNQDEAVQLSESVDAHAETVHREDASGIQSGVVRLPDSTEAQAETMHSPMQNEIPSNTTCLADSTEAQTETIHLAESTEPQGRTANLPEAGIQSKTVHPSGSVETPTEVAHESYSTEVQAETAHSGEAVEAGSETMSSPESTKEPIRTSTLQNTTEALPKSSTSDSDPLEAYRLPRSESFAQDTQAPQETTDIHETFKNLAQKFNSELKELEELKILNEDIEQASVEMSESDLDKAFKHNIRINPFRKQSRDVHWIRSSIKELVLLPIDYWKYMNAPFVIASYCKYRHFIIGRSEDKYYYLGIPESYNEKMIQKATHLGFMQFKCCEDVSPSEGAYGYWIMFVNKNYGIKK